MAGKTNIRGEQIKDGSIDSVDIASGSIKVGELSEKVIADQTLIASTDTTNDRLLIWDATDSALKQVSIGNLGVTASPAGSDTQVQYNNGGATGGASKLLYDDSNHRLGVGSTSAPSNTLTVSADISSDYVVLIDNDAGSSGHGLKVTTDGTGTGTTILDLEAASTTVFKVRGDGRVGIGVATPGSTLSVDDEIAVGESLIHRGDPDTLLAFADDKITLKAGNLAFTTLEKKGSAPHEITLNDGGNNIDFIVKGNGSNAGNPGMKFDASTNKLGINGVGTPSYELDVAGDIGLAEYIYHKGDDDTLIRFETDNITFKAGNVNFIELTEDDSQDKIVFNNAGADVDFIVESPSESTAIYLNAGNEVLHINHGESGFKTKIHSTHGEGVTVNEYGIIINEDGHATNDFRVESDNNTHMLFIDAGNDKVGIGTSSPRVIMDVHHDPTGLSDDTGGGEVVTFGTEDTTDTLAAGKLMYMATDGKWKYADADAESTSGGVLLGIALGTGVSDGILLRGFFDAATIQGSFAKGAVCYVSENEGVIDFTAPSASGDIIRVVGYGTDTANVIYFNPSSTWVELS